MGIKIAPQLGSWTLLELYLVCFCENYFSIDDFFYKLGNILTIILWQNFSFKFFALFWCEDTRLLPFILLIFAPHHFKKFFFGHIVVINSFRHSSPSIHSSM
nr:MAG TPA: hypothetical protein [Caudoviricetes sp.]